MKHFFKEFNLQLQLQLQLYLRLVSRTHELILIYQSEYRQHVARIKLYRRIHVSSVFGFIRLYIFRYLWITSSFKIEISTYENDEVTFLQIYRPLLSLCYSRIVRLVKYIHFLSGYWVILLTSIWRTREIVMSNFLLILSITQNSSWTLLL